MEQRFIRVCPSGKSFLVEVYEDWDEMTEEQRQIYIHEVDVENGLCSPYEYEEVKRAASPQSVPPEQWHEIVKEAPPHEACHGLDDFLFGIRAASGQWQTSKRPFQNATHWTRVPPWILNGPAVNREPDDNGG